MIERATSYRRVKRLAPDWDIIPSDEIFYLVECEDGEDLGIMGFHTCDQEGLSMHVELGLKCRGKKASAACKAAIEWVFTNTGCEILRGRIPPENKPSRLMACHIGYTFDEIDEGGLCCYSIEKRKFENKAKVNEW